MATTSKTLESVHRCAARVGRTLWRSHIARQTLEAHCLPIHVDDAGLRDGHGHNWISVTHSALRGRAWMTLGVQSPSFLQNRWQSKMFGLQEATVARWITNLRTVVIDPVVQRKMVDEVYALASASSAASQALTDWYQQNSPFSTPPEGDR